MLTKHLKFNFAFAIVCFLQLFLEINPTPIILIIDDFHYAIKPLIVIFLVVYLVIHNGLKGRFKKRIATGLVFGLIGDTLLMFVDVDEAFFLFGLAAFLLGHIFYISAFLVDYKSSFKTENHVIIVTAVIVSCILIAAAYFLLPYLGELEVPVLIYGLIISIMVIAAAARYGKVNNISFYYVFIGAVLFLVSDATLAFNKFVNAFSYAGLAIMATYMAAQYMITIGTIERKLKKVSKGSH